MKEGPAKEEIKKWAEKLKVSDYLEMTAEKLSKGNQQKIQFIASILHSPELIILDEPTSGLDPIVRNEILDIFREYIQEDETRSILISTHITTDLEHISDYIVFIEKGKIVFHLPTQELLENYGIIKCSQEDFLRLDEKDYIRYQKEKYRYEVLTNNKNRIKQKYNITMIDKPSIEDIMLFYIKGEK